MAFSGTALLPLHYGSAPKWLMEKMIRLGRAICEAVVIFYGRDELLRRLSDPFWFQSLGCLLGFDWHSSGLTTTLCGALKAGLYPVMDELGVYLCGGKGKTSLKTPQEIIAISDRTGLDGNFFVRMSKLSAKVDSVCLQDGFDLYHHTFIFTKDGKWAVIQQGMCPEMKLARRYHWFSDDVKSPVEEPHSAIWSPLKRKNVLNLIAKESRDVREATIKIKDLLELRNEKLWRLPPELVMPYFHPVKEREKYMKKIDESLRKLEENQPQTYEDLVLIKGMGKESIRALTLLSEVLCGAKPSFEDPVRYSFAHGGKDGHPYPVKRDVYEKTISFMEEVLKKARMNEVEKERALQRLKNLTLF